MKEASRAADSVRLYDTDVTSYAVWLASIKRNNALRNDYTFEYEHERAPESVWALITSSRRADGQIHVVVLGAISRPLKQRRQTRRHYSNATQ